MILALDPSLTTTGYAVLSSPERIAGMGIIRIKSAPMLARVNELSSGIAELVRDHTPEWIVVEIPQKGGANRGGYSGRAAMSGPVYGIAVGVAIMQALRHLPPAQVLTPMPMEWVGRGSIPSSKGDPKKVKRSRYVEYAYRLEPGSLGAASTAGNVADAVLLARWAWTAKDYRKIG